MRTYARRPDGDPAPPARGRARPAAATPEPQARAVPILEWQRAVGNRAVQRAVGDVDESKLARPQMELVAEGTGDTLKVNGVAAYSITPLTPGSQVKRVSGPSGSYAALPKAYSPAPGRSVSWRWTIGLTYESPVLVTETAQGAPALAKLFPSVEFAARLTVAPDVAALEREAAARAEVRGTALEVGAHELDNAGRPAFPPAAKPAPGERDLTSVRLIVQGGTSMRASVAGTHWKSRAELEQFMEDYIKVAAEDPATRGAADQARADRELILEELTTAEVDVLAGRLKLAQGQQYAADAAARLRVPVPEIMKPGVAVGEVLAIPTVKAVDVLLDFVPYVGVIKMAVEGVSGMTVSGQIDAAIYGTPDIDDVDRVIRLLPLAILGASRILARAPGWIEGMAKLRKGANLSEEALAKLLSDTAKLQGREQEVARALLAVRARQQAAAAAKLEKFVAGVERGAAAEKLEAAAAAEARGSVPPPSPGAAGAEAGAAKAPGAFTTLATGEQGAVYLDAEMTRVKVSAHPNLPGLRSALAREGAVLVEDASMSAAATADVGYIQVTGPGGAKFYRAVIRYHPDRAVLQDIWHEMNHLLDFKAGKIPPTYTLAAEDAARFAELQAKGPQELVAASRAAPKAAADAVEIGQSQARRFVAEMRNHLRDIESLQGARGTGYVENAQKAVKGFRTILENMVKTGNVRAGRLLEEGERQALRAYIETYVKGSFPDLPGAFDHAFPRQSFWDFLK